MPHEAPGEPEHLGGALVDHTSVTEDHRRSGSGSGLRQPDDARHDLPALHLEPDPSLDNTALADFLDVSPWSQPLRSSVARSVPPALSQFRLQSGRFPGRVGSDQTLRWPRTQTDSLTPPSRPRRTRSSWRPSSARAGLPTAPATTCKAFPTTTNSSAAWAPSPTPPPPVPPSTDALAKRVRQPPILSAPTRSCRRMPSDRHPLRRRRLALVPFVDARYRRSAKTGDGASRPPWSGT